MKDVFRRFSRRCFCALLCSLAACLTTEARSDKPDPQQKAEQADAKNREELQNGIRNGRKLATDLTVRGNIKAQATLIPQVDAKRIFGAEVANNYAVIAITVANKSTDAAFIIHGAFIDYKNWGLSGLLQEEDATADSTGRPEDQATAQTNTSFQTNTSPKQVASVESRLVRGQLLDAQQWTARNWTIRLLTLAGSVASGYSFAFKEAGIAKGIAAFNGNLTPGLSVAWPDGTIPQLNRISDFGYQTNKVIPRQASDIIVCFFPIDRFLTPGFRKLFLTSPAVFFAPLQMLYDPAMKKVVENALKPVFSYGGIDADKLRTAIPCYLRLQKARNNAPRQKEPAFGPSSEELNQVCKGLLDAKTVLALDFINQMSLNTITVVVEGVMSVETALLAAKIDDITLDGDDHKSPNFWAAAGERKGTIRGSYLTGGEVRIVEAEQLGITDVAVISEGSSDQQLRFSFKLTKPVPVGTTLHFVVTKKLKPDTSTVEKEAKSVDSNEYAYPVVYAITAPAVTKVEAKDGKLMVTGTGFLSTTANPLKLTLHPRSGGGKDIPLTPEDNKDPKSLAVSLSNVPSGCYTAQVTVGTMSTPDNGQPFAVVKMDSAARQGNQIVVTGNGFTSPNCKVNLKFKLESGQTSQSINPKDTKPAQVTFDMPTAAKTGTWSVRMLVGSDEKGQTQPLK